MYPGDFILDSKFNLTSPYHSKLKPEGLTHLIDEGSKNEIAKKRQPSKISATEAKNVLEKLKEHIHNKLYVIPEEKGRILNMPYNLPITTILYIILLT